MRFETAAGTAAVVDPNGSGRWYAAAADGGSVQVLSPASSGRGQTGRLPEPMHRSLTATALSLLKDRADRSSTIKKPVSGNCVMQKCAGPICRARDSASGNWVAANTGGQVVLDPASRQLEIYGTNTAVARDATGSYVAANTGGSVFLDSNNPGGARWEVRGTDTPVMQAASGQWVAADSRGGVVWDAQQNRFEQAGTNAAAYRDPGGSGWYSVASNGMVTQLGNDSQWRSVDPSTAPIRVDQGGNVTAAASNGLIQFDQRDNRWEIAGTNQAVQYDSRSQQWVAPETGGRVAYDFNDRRLEVVGLQWRHHQCAGRHRPGRQRLLCLRRQWRRTPARHHRRFVETAGFDIDRRVHTKRSDLLDGICGSERCNPHSAGHVRYAARSMGSG